MSFEASRSGRVEFLVESGFETVPGLLSTETPCEARVLSMAVWVSFSMDGGAIVRRRFVKVKKV